MGKIFLVILFAINAIYSLIHPWFGVTIGYLFNILGPQYIWWWHFQGLRGFYLIAIPTLLGFFFSFSRGALNFDIIKNKRVFLSVLYFLFVFLSYFWGPYVDVVNEWRFYEPYQVLITMLKIFAFYFVGLVCISDEKKLRIFSFVLPLSVLYLSYWANMQYLLEYSFLRLKGPRDISGSGIYGDENMFAMLFVTGIPFLFYLGWFFKRWYLRYSMWLAIPFVWHAIFLTASRGGLVGAAFVSLLSGFRCPKKIVGLMLLFSFGLAYLWQGGSMMKQRAQTISNYEEESSARARLDSWAAGLKMFLTHPITGVGLASYGQAFPSFSDKKPRVAHNTFLEIAAECGLFAFLSYILTMILTLWDLFFLRNRLSVQSFEYYLSDAVFISLFGFLVCSLFLTLNRFEIQFYLLILANTLVYLSRNGSIVLK